ncbi:MAG: hypothetical protein P9M08_01110 [Candidatus Erginobacter occultus]|nr:hypothetical protein [Candidatus Erginobacter occultus]
MGKLGLGLVILSMWLIPARADDLVGWTADFNGDGTDDVTIFRPATGLWAVRGVTRFYFGGEDDIPVPGYYDGTGAVQPAIFRPATGLWAVREGGRSYFGRNNDQPHPGDYNDDGWDNLAIFRPATGLWAIKGLTRAYFGREGDIAVPADYREPGQTGIAIFRPATGLWSIRGLTRVYFGSEGDIPIPGDYYGFGTAEPAIFRPATGLWAAPGGGRVYFGQAGDQPQPANYFGRGTKDVAIFRPSTGLWALRDLTRFYFGGQDDPTPSLLQWRDGYDVATFEVENGVFEFWTRNIRKPSSPNYGGMYEYIICRLNGENINRLLICSMYDRSPRIDLDWGGGYRFVDGLFQQPLPGPSHWRVASDRTRIWIELDGREIWSESGQYWIEEAIMCGYAERGFLGEWSSAE